MLNALPLFETHVHTTNLEQAALFYEQVLGLTCAYFEENRRARFYYIGGHGQHMLGVWEVPPEKMVPRQFSLGVTPEVFRHLPAWLSNFEDPDGNQIEILAILPDAPGPVVDVAPPAVLLADATICKTHVQTADPARSEAFYTRLLGAPIQVDEELGARFYGFGDGYRLGVWATEPGLVKRSHFAWGTTPAHFPSILEWLRHQGIPLRNFHNTGEDPLVLAWMPAVSIYFRDPDGHSLEVVAMLPDGPRPDLNVVPWEAWEAMHGR
jgi:lactoylglutathione lyase